MIIFNKRNSDGKIISTITVDDDHPEYPKTFNEVIEYWWDKIPYGYKLEQYL